MNKFRRILRTTILIAALTGTAFSALLPSMGQEPSRRGRTASGRNAAGEFPVRWSEPVDFDYREVPLDDLLASRAKIDRFAFFVDRRVDPGLPIDYSAREKSLGNGMMELAASAGLEAVVFGPILYVGPPGAAGEFLLSAELCSERASQSPNGAAQKLRTKLAIEEKDFGDPRTILVDLARKIGLKWEGLEMMPLDCWRAVRLPERSVGELFSLLLIGFGVGWELDDIKPILRPVSLKRYGDVSRSYAERDAKNFPPEFLADCRRTEVAGTVRVEGPFASVARVGLAAARNRLADEWSAEESGESGNLGDFIGTGGRGGILVSDVAETGRERGDGAGNGSGEKTAGRQRLMTGEVRQVKLGVLFDRMKRDFQSDFRLDPSCDALGISSETPVSCRFEAADRKKAARIVANRLGVSVRFTDELALFYRKK